MSPCPFPTTVTITPRAPPETLMLDLANHITPGQRFLVGLMHITTTYFKHKQIHKNSWMHTRFKQWYFIDYIIIQQHNLPDFLNTRVMRGTNCSNEHVMIKSTTELQVRWGMMTVNIPIRKLATHTIKINRVRNDLQAMLNVWLSELPTGSVEENWNAFKSIVYKISKEELATAVRKHKG